jgi:hypothetical protein
MAFEIREKLPLSGRFSAPAQVLAAVLLGCVLLLGNLADVAHQHSERLDGGCTICHFSPDAGPVVSAARLPIADFRAAERITAPTFAGRAAPRGPYTARAPPSLI